MQFTLRQLGYFIAAGEEGSIRKASERINVSQPSISTAISQLENSFDLQLFIRHHAQGLSLTSAGKTFLLEAKQFISHGHELEQMAGELGSEIGGHINVACLSSVAALVIPELCHQFDLCHERIAMQANDANQAEIFADLGSGKVDVALTYNLDLPTGIEFTPLLSLAPYAVMSSRHPLAGEVAVSLAELAGEPLVLLDLPYSREYFLSLFRQYKLTPHIGKRTGLSEVMRGLVASGYGYSLANVRPLNKFALNGGGLVYIEIADDCPPLQLGLATLARLRRSRAVDAFISHCQTATASGHIPGTEASAKRIP